MRRQSEKDVVLMDGLPRDSVDDDEDEYIQVTYTSPVLGRYDVKLHPAVLHLLSSLCRSLKRSFAPLRYW